MCLIGSVYPDRPGAAGAGVFLAPWTDFPLTLSEDTSPLKPGDGDVPVIGLSKLRLPTSDKASLCLIEGTMAQTAAGF